jgi:hypothetical protein
LKRQIPIVDAALVELSPARGRSVGACVCSGLLSIDTRPCAHSRNSARLALAMLLERFVNEPVKFASIGVRLDLLILKLGLVLR